LRIAVTGTAGQVVRALDERAGGHAVTMLPLGRPGLDLAAPESVAPALRAARPDAVVNAAAYTAVDKAESEAGLALAVNGAGAGAVAEAAAVLGIPVLQLSTDYVFDGTGDRPWREDDPTAPLGSYGRSKLAGEAAVRHATRDHAILRTAWVYSPFGQNFVRTMLRLARTRETVTVVADQHGCPTSALDLADGLLRVARNLVERPAEAGLRGTFHMAGAGDTSWCDFARAVFAAAAVRGGPSARVEPIATADYPTPAQRPRNSRLDCGKLARVHGVALPPWPGSLDACVARLLESDLA
jgi:dTDP-4-dehydrorhamnose reductase